MECDWNATVCSAVWLAMANENHPGELQDLVKYFREVANMSPEEAHRFAEDMVLFRRQSEALADHMYRERSS